MNPSVGTSAEPLVESLSRREREILALLAQGYTGPEIAERLTIALSSVRSHLHNLYRKLGVNNKRGALNRAQALRLLGTPPPASTSQSRLAPAPRHNLPMELTRFFGRELEIAQLNELLAEYRLVTVTGAGGVGKTRLSLRVAEEALADFENGVTFVQLAALSDPALVAQQAAVDLGVHDDPERPSLEILTEYLRDREHLLVLDNCEHLLDACAGLADHLLRACPRLTVLATSRQPLGIAGEGVFRAPTLPFPDPDQLPPIERLSDFAALTLFIDRARAVLPGYSLDDHNAGALARICQRLDGIPLALELAAARMNILTAEQLAERLTGAFDLLTGGSRTALPRHRTLRATIDWSYQLLTEKEQILLRRLSVFAGGCKLLAAERVCSGEGLETGQAILAPVVGAEIVDLLAALVDKSMVVADRQAGRATRFRLLEMVRQYGHEKLEAAGESERMRQRHLDYFLAFLETVEGMDHATAQLPWASRLGGETDNLRLALEWAFSHPADVTLAPRLVSAIFWRWPTHEEYVSWSKRALDFCEKHAPIPGVAHAGLLRTASDIMSADDPRTVVDMLQQAVDISRQLGAEGRISLYWSLQGLAWHYVMELKDAAPARAPMEEMQALLAEFAWDTLDPERYYWQKAEWALMCAEIALQQGQFENAKTFASESIPHYQKSGGFFGRHLPRLAIGEACLNLREYDQAREHFLAALGLVDEISTFVGDIERAVALSCLGRVDFQEGKWDRAFDYFGQSLQLAIRGHDRYGAAGYFGLLARLSVVQGHAERAARLVGASAAQYARQGRPHLAEFSLDRLLPGWRDGPNPAAIGQAFVEGQAMPDDQAVAYALGAAVV